MSDAEPKKLTRKQSIDQYLSTEEKYHATTTHLEEVNIRRRNTIMGKLHDLYMSPPVQVIVSSLVPSVFYKRTDER